MKELTNIELQFIISIAATYPYSFQEVSMIYRRTRSFDKTWFVVKQANIIGCGLIDVLNEPNMP